jgi:hypothetical protein
MLEIFNVVLDHNSVHNGHKRTLVTVIREKIKTYAMRPKRQSKILKGKSVRSDATTEDKNSPAYKESNDSSSRIPSDDGNDGDDTGGGTVSLAAQGGGYERPLSPFTADQFTHCV